MDALEETSSPAGVATVPIARQRPWAPGGWLLAGLWVLTVVSVVGMLAVGDRLIIGALGFVVMMLLILLRVPIAVSLLVPALLGIFSIGGLRLLESLAGRTPYGSIASWSLSALPMFVLMGVVVASGGLAGSLFQAARQWLRWLPGGLAVGTNLAGAGLAAVTGSTLGTSYVLARVGVPEMLRAGYHKRIAIMAVMTAGLPGQLIPPSILLVIYAGLVQAPVGPQLIAGVIPGILIAVVFSVMMLLLALVLGGRAGGEKHGEPVPFPTMLKAALAAWPVPVLVLVIMGGMFSGVFTATEAGAGAALVAVLMAIGTAVKSGDWKSMGAGLTETVQSVGMMFLLLIGAQFLTEMFSLTGVSAYFQDWVVGAGFTRVTFLLAMLVFYLLLGLAMDTLAMMLLTIPVLVPTLQALDIPLIFFGVFVVLLAEISSLSPPVGFLLFVLHDLFQDPKVNVGQRITLNDLFMAVWYLLPGAVLVLLLMIWFPDIVMFLPNATAASSP
ncbi:TRAP transporter large permease subunit [Nonomuraea sp. NPDC005650]|uniref:TRAP transporter large permease n=1 Tax=Nonomuraea sp. NPDC005650 TaxID=3157045 RepID=UPI0033B3E665